MHLAVLPLALALVGGTALPAGAQLDTCGGLCSGYRLEAGDMPPAPHSFFVSPPTAVPPARRLVHWDLREFPGCRVPFSINQPGTPDIAGLATTSLSPQRSRAGRTSPRRSSASTIASTPPPTRSA